MRETIAISVCSLIILCMLISGCILDETISDWEYEHYYYIDIQNNSTNNYTILVPLPSASDMQEKNTKLKYFDNYVKNLRIEKGICTYEIVEYNSNKYLQIKGSFNISISSSFKLWDSCATVSIEKEGPHQTMIYSDSSNISIIIDSRAVRKTNEKETWDLYYSVAIDPDMDFSIPTKHTWKDHLSEEYFLQPISGWHSYLVKEESEWNRILIK